MPRKNNFLAQNVNEIKAEKCWYNKKKKTNENSTSKYNGKSWQANIPAATTTKRTETRQES